MIIYQIVCLVNNVDIVSLHTFSLFFSLTIATTKAYSDVGIPLQFPPIESGSSVLSELLCKQELVWLMIL